ncbi:N-acetyltransferase eso1 [Coemansia sp. RSA 1822]|nr:N-acetyltransferase eso1 [Coemansia sp. RSA 638]KAJ2560273.1 N-acetyltransferase eso1 [Coemansia sp. RSA 1822]
MDTVREAREKCPELVLVHVATFTGSNPPAYHKSPSANTHKVSLDEYRRASRRIMNLFKLQCSTISKASVDEAYFDASEMLRQKIVKDFERGVLELSSGRDAVEMDQMLLSPMPYDSDIDMALPVPVVRWVTVSRKGKEKEMAAMSASPATEYGVLVGDPPPVSFGWGDLLLQYAATFAQQIRATLFQELGYRASAGVSYNRFLAKIGSGLNKPDQQTVILSSQAESFLYLYPVTNIPSLGGKLGALVENAFGAQTAGDLMNHTVDQLALKLGPEQAQFLYNRCHGIDDSPVEDNKEPGTLTSAKNFMRYPVESLSKLDRWISMNSVDLWTRVIEEWEMRKRWPRSLTISFTPRGQNQRSKTTAFPLRLAKGAHNSPDAVAAAVRACLSASDTEADSAGRGRPPRHQSSSMTQTSGMFPMIGFSLTAKSFQRELASASMMERWLIRPRNSTSNNSTATDGVRATRAKQQVKVQNDPTEQMGVGLDECALHPDSVDDIASRMSSIGSASTHDLNEDEFIPALAPQRLSSMLQLASQPTTQVQPSRRYTSYPSLLPQGLPSLSHTLLPAQGSSPALGSGGYLPAVQSSSVNSPASSLSSSSLAQTPPLLVNSSHFAGAESHTYPGANDSMPTSSYYGNTMNESASSSSSSPPPLFLSDSTVQPDLVCGSEYDTSDSDASLLKTPPESDSDGYEENEDDEAGEIEAESDDLDEPESTDDAAQAIEPISEAANIIGSQDKMQSLQNRASTSGGRRDDGTGGDRHTQGRATGSLSRPRNNVYIQSITDLESAARYGEGYKHIEMDQHDDGSLVVARPDDANTGTDGFVPALIAATRRKREIQIVRFQNPVDMPEGAISGSRINQIKAKKPRNRASSSRASSASEQPGARAKVEDGSELPIAEDDEDDRVDAEYDSSTDDEISSVLGMAVSAMMESISASQAVMQIHCPQCPENASPIPSREWETHRDWHIAKHLQERELRHESVARHIQGAFANSDDTEKPPSKRTKRETPPSGRRQQTITEAWK